MVPDGQFELPHWFRQQLQQHVLFFAVQIRSKECGYKNPFT